SAHDVPAGTTSVAEGAVGQGLYAVLSGAVEIHKEEAGLEVLLATLGPGEIFGEISLLHEERASATVTASAPSTVLFLRRETFRKLVEAVPAIGDYVRDLGEERLMDTRILLDGLDGP
ncbi:MAG: cyclic nucleotide-binding domain-containing protein, partial [Sandaracinaceae bacterium]